MANGIQKDLGKVTAYSYAKAAGYTGTEAEFQQVFDEFTRNAPGLITRMDTAVERAEAAVTNIDATVQDAVDDAVEEATASAVATANQAVSDAQAAQTAAEGAVTQANNAVTQANAAVTAAQAAQSAAEDAAESFVLDRTLTDSGAAAPADLVGDLKTAIGDFTVFGSNLAWSQGTINASGSNATNQYTIRSDYVEVGRNSILYTGPLSLDNADIYVMAALYKDENGTKTFLERPTIVESGNESNWFLLNPECTHVRFVVGHLTSTHVNITPSKGIYFNFVLKDTYYNNFVLDPNNYVALNDVSITSSNKWTDTNSCTLIPIDESWKYLNITTDAQQGTVLAFLTNNTVTIGSSPSFSAYYSSRIVVSTNANKSYYIPYDAKYLYVLLISSTGLLTQHIKITISTLDHDEPESKFDSIEKFYDCPSLHANGSGVVSSPYSSDDGTAGMAKAISDIENGGKIHIYKGIYNVTQQIVINKKNLNIEGDTWNYPDDPNGVYPSNTGTKFALLSDEIPSVFYSASNVSGMRISQIGIQGLTTTWDTSDASGNDSSYYFSPSDIKNVGYYFGNSGRIDQCNLHRISFCGLAVGVLAKYTVDANVWSELNTDGCDFGIFVDYNTCHHPKIINNITSDCTGCGIFYKTTAGDNSYGLVASGNVLVRNASYLTAEQIAYGIPQASLCLIGHKYASICENTIVLSGTYKRTSGAGIPYTGGIGLYFSGSYSVISNNKISDSTGKAAEISGDNNSITGNMIKDTNDGVVINGDGNIVSGNMLDSVLSVTGDNNKIQQNIITGNITLSGDNNIIEGSPSNTITVSGNNNILVGFATANVTDNGTGTVIK